MDTKQKIKLKCSKKQLLRKNRGPLSKPDMMLITKDVMVPVKLPPSYGKPFPDTQNQILTKSKVARAQRVDAERLKPLLSPGGRDDNYRDRLQVKKVGSEKNIGRGTVPESMFYRVLRADTVEGKVCEDETQRVSLEREELSLKINWDLLDLDKKDREYIGAVKISGVKKPLTLMSRNSISGLTTFAEVSCCSSSKSLDVLDESSSKLSFGIISSCKSGNNISACDRSLDFEYCSRISLENNNSQNVVEDIIEIVGSSKTYSNINDDHIKSNVVVNLESNESEAEHIHKELTESSTDSITKEQSGASKDNNSSDKKRDDRRTTEVDYLLQSLLTSLDHLEDFNSFDNCNGNIDIKEQNSESILLDSKKNISKKLEDNLNERVLNIVEFRYSSHKLSNTTSALDNFNHSHMTQPNIDLKRGYSWQEFSPLNSVSTAVESDEECSRTICNNLDTISNQSNEQIEIKYSWQIIIPKTQDVSTQLGERSKDPGQNDSSIAKNSKLTCTEDLLRTYEPEFRYSWQKLTSKYLAGNHARDNFLDTNQAARNTNDIPKNAINTESIKDYSPFKETCMHSNFHSIKNLEKEKKNKAAEDIEKIAMNSPLNSIISSMLPEIKLNGRSASLNGTTADITSSYKDNYLGSHAGSDLNKSSISYPTVSSIKHIIANLNEMVTTQKHMLDAYEKNHGFDESFNMANLADDIVEKVEIFPSTLHVLGNYIVRDICPTDMNNPRRLLNPNDNEIMHDHLISNNFKTVQDIRLDKPVENVPNEKIPPAIVTPANLNPKLSTRRNDSSSRSPLDVREANFSSMLSHPVSLNGSYYSQSFATNDDFVPTMRNLKKDEASSCSVEMNGNSLLLPVLGYDRALIGNNWNPTMGDHEEIFRLSLSTSSSSQQDEDDENIDLPDTKDTEPLKPRLDVSLSETKETGDGIGCKDELSVRRESVMSKLKQYEQQVDTNWDLDCSVLVLKEGTPEKHVQLPERIEKHMKEIMKSAEDYLVKLEEQLDDLKNADDQIINSSERTLKNIDESYQVLMDNIGQEINKRRNLLRLQTEVFKYEGLAPLRACKQEVDALVRSTQHVIVLTENMLTHPVTFNKERYENIITASSHMGRLAAVPMPEELPYMTFSPPNEDLQEEIIQRISQMGRVVRIGPVQFAEISERPACLYLKWHIIHPEYTSEEQTFVVQKAFVDIHESTPAAFQTVYIGPETSCFARNLPTNIPIILRVGIQVSDSAWSTYRTAQTSIPAYSWDMHNPDYMIRSSGRIANKVTHNPSTLLSRGPQFGANYIIELKFLEAGLGSDNEGVGLVFEPDGVNESLKRNGALLITPNGNIFMNGEQKLMQLPELKLGTTIVFKSERKDARTLRVTIECTNKEVTYDWTVQTPLHFAARFLKNSKWNFMVQ